MTRREWALSVFFVAVITLKVAEAALRLEWWPLSDVRMFSHRVPPTATVWRVTLHGARGGAWMPLGPGDFRLSEDEFLRRLPPVPSVLPERCAELGRLYNADPRFADRPLDALEVRLTKVPRPGTAAAPFVITIPCRPGGAS